MKKIFFIPTCLWRWNSVLSKRRHGWREATRQVATDGWQLFLLRRDSSFSALNPNGDYAAVRCLTPATRVTYVEIRIKLSASRCVPIPVAARLVRLWVRNPPGVWMSVCFKCCVLSGTDICDELITRPEESYRVWRVVVCDLETSWLTRPWPNGGCCAKNKIRVSVTLIYLNLFLYIGQTVHAEMFSHWTTGKKYYYLHKVVIKHNILLLATWHRNRMSLIPQLFLTHAGIKVLLCLRSALTFHSGASQQEQ